jgi:hypothetical protein
MAVVMFSWLCLLIAELTPFEAVPKVAIPINYIDPSSFLPFKRGEYLVWDGEHVFPFYVKAQELVFSCVICVLELKF